MNDDSYRLLVVRPFVAVVALELVEPFHNGLMFYVSCLIYVDVDKQYETCIDQQHQFHYGATNAGNGCSKEKTLRCHR
jgi:hypothetical protein